MTDGENGGGEGRVMIDRRRFVQRMAADATTIAGRVQGLSQVVAGSIGAAGHAVVDNLESIRAQDARASPNTPANVVAPSEPPTSAPSPGALPAPAKRPPQVLDEDQIVVLGAAREGIVAVNDPVNGPHLGVVAIAWNGRGVVFAAIGHSRRATLLGYIP